MATRKTVNNIAKEIQKRKSQEEREYYILAGSKGMMKLLKEKEINLTPTFFMIIKEKSKLGNLIKQEEV